MLDDDKYGKKYVQDGVIEITIDEYRANAGYWMKKANAEFKALSIKNEDGEYAMYISGGYRPIPAWPRFVRAVKIAWATFWEEVSV